METERKPSDFNVFPFSSALQNSETEVVAMNVMLILKRTGDAFRPLEWEEYAKERKEDGEFTEGEKQYFERAIGYFKSADTAKLFSKACLCRTSPMSQISQTKKLGNLP